MSYQEEFEYKANKFTTAGYFNGFPIKPTDEKPDHLWGQTLGLSQKNLRKECAVNHYWNLASIETHFVIQTEVAPAPYTTGFVYNSQSSTPETGQIVTCDYESVNTYNSGSYPPEYRMFPENTGETEVQTLDSNNLVRGSGKKHFSASHIADDFYIPLTIQPENTGAFVLTLDSGVAKWFSEQSGYSDQIDKFQCNMLFDMGYAVADDKNAEFNNIEYYSFQSTGYLVPASGWRFSILGSKVKGIYYNYPFKEAYKYTPKGKPKFVPPKDVNPKFVKGGGAGKNKLLDEPSPGNGSRYDKDPRTQIMVCNVGTAGRKDQNRGRFPSFPKKTRRHKGYGPYGEGYSLGGGATDAADHRHESKLANDYWKERDNRGGR